MNNDKTFKSYKSESRKNWGRFLENDEVIDLYQIQTGAILRIADAVETMAQNVRYLINKNVELEKRNEKLKNQLRGKNGALTKLKNENLDLRKEFRQ